jgi:hypothetical protein
VEVKLNELDELRLRIAKAKGWGIYKIGVEPRKYIYPLPPEDHINLDPADISDGEIHWQSDAPDWPRDIAAAWELWDEMTAAKVELELSNQFSERDPYMLKWSKGFGDIWHAVLAATVQKAIARAWLAWKEANE